MRPELAATLAILASLTAPAFGAPTTDKRQASSGLSLTAQLQIADSHAARYQLLTNDSDFVFDFKTAQFPMATRQNFPALVGTGVAIAVATFPPCSMSLIHLHPRATEIFAITNGTVHTSMVPEAGVLNANNTQRVIQTTLGAGMVTVFPQGSFHTQANLECEGGTAVAAFNSDDPGTGPIVSELLALSDDVVLSSLGGVFSEADLVKLRAAQPMTGMTGLFSLDECAARCGIKRL